jgi:hypothetical protein
LLGIVVGGEEGKLEGAFDGKREGLEVGEGEGALVFNGVVLSGACAVAEANLRFLVFENIPSCCLLLLTVNFRLEKSFSAFFDTFIKGISLFLDTKGAGVAMLDEWSQLTHEETDKVVLDEGKASPWWPLKFVERSRLAASS